MKLKSLLLGSAAAMIAVTGARAADVVVAEPEPMEYVKVCDMYGAGFYYIPGTETCLNINGYVRVDYTHVEINGTSHNRWDYRARINFDARNETDWGTLRSEIRVQGDGPTSSVPGAVAGNGDANAVIDRALIHLAGLRLGYSDTYVTTVHGYGLPVEKYDGYYGYDQATFLDYTYAANGFAGTIGVQASEAAQVGNTLNLDYYAGVAYSGSWGSIAGSYIFEELSQDASYKVSATITALEGLTVKGFFMGDHDGNTRAVAGAADYAYGIGANYQIMDNLGIRGGYSGIEGGKAGPADFFVVGLNWAAAPGLFVRPEAVFLDNDRQEYSIRVYRTW